MTTHSLLVEKSTRRSIIMVLVAGLILLLSILYHFAGNALSMPAAQISSAQAFAKTMKTAKTASKAAVEEYEMRIQRNPQNASNYAGLGLSLLQEVRETGDTSFYARSGKALDKALELDPKNVDALVGQGVLALALHDFSKALDWAGQAWTLNQFKAEILGIKVDGLVELGRYEEAVVALQQMVDLRPDTSSYSRISYLRELHGDVKGAIQAMQMAVESTPIGTESWLWSLTHLGNLYLNSGDLTQAGQVYQQVLQLRADYPYAIAGSARVFAAQGSFNKAITILKPVSERLPLPEFLTLLGEIYEVQGDMKLAHEQYDLVNVVQQLNSQAGMNVDLEMALFNANHANDANATVTQARFAYAKQPTIYGADALAWALYKADKFEDAKVYSDEALRLGTADAMLYFHAGMIAMALGDAATAKTHLERSLAINPYFSILDAPIARQTLQTIQ